MVTSDAKRRVARRGSRRGSRRERRTVLPNRRDPARKPQIRASSSETTANSSTTADESRPIRIRPGEIDAESSSEASRLEEREARPTRAEEATATGGDGDPDSQLQMTLDLSDPEPRGYEASATPPRERIDTTRLLWLAMRVGAVTCLILLGFQLVFTNPAHGLNVLAVVVTMSFGALFATWTFEYWLRRGTAATARNLPIWTLTRHAILASVGVAAMAVSALNRTASFGLLILVIFTLVVADIVLGRLRIR